MPLAGCSSVSGSCALECRPPARVSLPSPIPCACPTCRYVPTKVKGLDGVRISKIACGEILLPHLAWNCCAWRSLS